MNTYLYMYVSIYISKNHTHYTVYCWEPQPSSRQVPASSAEKWSRAAPKQHVNLGKSSLKGAKKGAPKDTWTWTQWVVAEIYRPHKMDRIFDANHAMIHRFTDTDKRWMWGCVNGKFYFAIYSYLCTYLYIHMTYVCQYMIDLKWHIYFSQK